MKFAISILFLPTLSLAQSTRPTTRASTYVDLVRVDAARPFYIEIFETSCEEANRLLPGTCNFSGKPARVYFDTAAQICDLKNMRLPTEQEWLQAASDLGRNTTYTLVGGNSLRRDAGTFAAKISGKQDGSFAANIASGASFSPYDFVNVGIDSAGTVGMTGNRAEWVTRPGRTQGQCGGEYETTDPKAVELANICSASAAPTATARCVVEATSRMNVTYSPNVTGALLEYLDSRVLGRPKTDTPPKNSVDDLLIEGGGS